MFLSLDRSAIQRNYASKDARYETQERMRRDADPDEFARLTDSFARLLTRTKAGRTYRTTDASAAQERTSVSSMGRLERDYNQ